jgi:hypothetical protein
MMKGNPNRFVLLPFYRDTTVIPLHHDTTTPHPKGCLFSLDIAKRAGQLRSVPKKAVNSNSKNRAGFLNAPLSAVGLKTSS